MHVLMTFFSFLSLSFFFTLTPCSGSFPSVPSDPDIPRFVKFFFFAEQVLDGFCMLLDVQPEFWLQILQLQLANQFLQIFLPWK